MMPATVVIVGAGHGGFQMAASLRQGGFEGRVILLGDEPGLPYQRPPLSKDYLDGKIGLDLLPMRPEAFYRDHRIELVEGARAVAIDRAARRALLATGPPVAYDHLVLATGARNRVAPIPGADLDGVCYLRTLAESDMLRERLGRARNIVVVGAGFIGLEFAAVATAKGARIRVIELAERAMARVVTPATSQFFADYHRRGGVRLSFGAQAVGIVGDNGRAAGVELSTGERLPADLVVVSIGVVPNAELAAAAGLPVANGILVDAHLLTADKAISAIGDCACFPSRHTRHNPVRLESVQNAADHARCVAERLLGEARDYASLPWFWSEQGALRLQIAGLTAGYDRTVLRGDIASGEFSVFCFEGDALLGIESTNRPTDHAHGRRLLAAGRGISAAEAGDMSFDLRAAAMARRA